MSVRAPVFAGSFYPADKKVLSEVINDFLLQAGGIKNVYKNAHVRALIVPHAGYVYSGATAAFSYNLLRNAKPKKIVLFGPSHYAYFRGALGFSWEWQTPLGKQRVLSKGLNVLTSDKEHSLEVQLPFLQTVLSKFDFVPIIFGEISSQKLAQRIEEFLSSDTVLIASSDLSHYFSYDKATRVDKATINSVLLLDLNEFESIGDACGKTGIGALIILARKNNWKCVLLDYKNSGDTAGDKSRVVGYCAIAFFEQ